MPSVTTSGTKNILSDSVDGSPRRALLKIQWSDARGKHSAVVREDATLGSSEAADIVVADPAVSRMHCRFETRGSAGFWLRDLDSTNGTWISGFRVESAALPHAGVIQVGPIEIQLLEDPQGVAVQLWPDDHYRGLLGASTVMRELFARIDQIAKTELPVVISGETGTGKELIARAVHAASPRAQGPLVVVDCTTLPADMADAELFGHLKGAFTDALRERAGAFEEANGGTVFLDEIGELPLETQPKLLRVLESKEIRRLGENQHRLVDVRVIAATHRDMGAMINEGRFREDLYFRLAGAMLHSPSLRRRPEDIPLLVRAFAGEERDVATVQQIVEYAASRGRDGFPGNVRQLRSFVHRALVFGPDTDLAPAREQLPTGLPDPDIRVPFPELRAYWNEHLERVYLERMIEKHGRSLLKLSKASGIGRSHVHRLLVRHNL